MRILSHSSIALATILSISACGAGSSGSSPATGGDAAVVAPTPTPSPTSTPAPTPAPTASIEGAAGYVLSPTIDGAAPAKAAFSIASGTEKIPVTTQKYNDWEGAFRFICGGDGKPAYDDPVLFPGQSGRSHLHQPWGNSDFNAFTTPNSLLQSASTNCNNSPNSLNRSLYWQPALITDTNQVVQPDLVALYYKRKISTSDGCTANSGKFKGTCVGIPNQIRFIFGWDPTTPTAKVRGASWFCTGKSADGKHYNNLDDVFANGCRAGDTLTANTRAPDCWDGKYLDTPDHRSHMAWPSYTNAGYEKCPVTHPYVIPQQENKASWTVTADMYAVNAQGVAKSRIRLSSDDMLPGGKPGETLHADYMEGWVWEAKQAWQENCIEKRLSCSAGDLGNGRRLVGADKPAYGWLNPHPRIAMPLKP